jgi:hypothetical protein
MRQAPESVGGKIMKLRLSARAAKVRAATLTGMAARPSRGRSILRRAQEDFAKLKTLLRKAEERTVDGLWRRIGGRLDAFTRADKPPIEPNCPLAPPVVQRPWSSRAHRGYTFPNHPAGRTPRPCRGRVEIGRRDQMIGEGEPNACSAPRRSRSPQFRAALASVKLRTRVPGPRKGIPRGAGGRESS